MTRARMVTGVLVLCAFGAVRPAASQIVAPAGRTLFNRAVMLRSFVRIDSFSEPRPDDHVRRVVNPYAVVWGVHPDASVTIVTPIVSVRQEHERRGALVAMTTTGVADPAVFLRYDWLRHLVPGGFTRLSPEIGVKLPWGGAFSSDATDVTGALIFSHVRGRHWVVTDLQLTKTTTTSVGQRAGDRWRHDLAYMYRLWSSGPRGSPGGLVVLELNTEHVGRTRLDGAPLPDTGGTVLSITPGLEIFASDQMVVEVAVPLPVSRDLNGTQSKPAISLIMGVRWLL